MRKRLSLIILCLLLFSSVATAFHHHDDAGEHDDCPVCAVSHHHQAADVVAPFVFSSIISYTIATWLLPDSPAISDTDYTPANNRAPPA